LNDVLFIVGVAVDLHVMNTTAFAIQRGYCLRRHQSARELGLKVPKK
jgi:hypothetical protein